MKKNILTITGILLTSVIGTIGTGTIYAKYVMKNEATKRGYTLNKETGRYEKQLVGLDAVIGGSFDQISYDLAVRSRIDNFAEKAMFCTFVFSFIVPFITGIKKNK